MSPVLMSKQSLEHLSTSLCREPSNLDTCSHTVNTVSEKTPTKKHETQPQSVVSTTFLS